jgi:hypothetical protein
MEEPLFPFFSEGDEHELQHCFDCGLPLPDQGDPDVIYVVVQNRDGAWETQPACRRHWRDTLLPQARRTKKR